MSYSFNNPRKHKSMLHVRTSGTCCRPEERRTVPRATAAAGVCVGGGGRQSKTVRKVTWPPVKAVK